MSDVRRFVDTIENPAARSLLEAGLHDGPSRAAFERTALALGVAGVSTGIGAAASAASSGAAAKATLAAAGASPATSAAGATVTSLLGKWFVVGAIAGGTLTGVATVAVPPPGAGHPAVPARSATAVTRSTAIGRSEARVAVQPEHMVSAASPEPAALVESGPKPTASPEPARNRHATAAPEPPRVAASPVERAAAALAESGVSGDPAARLGVDVALIDAARRAFRAGDAAGALVALDRYERERQTRVLDREARLLRIDALSRAGRTDLAARLAGAFIAEFPDDPRAARLRVLIDGTRANGR